MTKIQTPVDFLLGSETESWMRKPLA